jgi:DNA-binding NtrC family response regulator
MALVLCTGADRNLVETRKLLLEDAGHKVVTAVNESALKKACEQYNFDVAVIGQTIAAAEKLRIFSIVRELRPSAKVLELYRVYSPKTLVTADDWLEVPADVPLDLSDHVAALAEKR